MQYSFARITFHKCEFYFTVTTQVLVTFPAFTVMVAFPAFFAVTFPFASTVATFLLELL